MTASTRSQSGRGGGSASERRGAGRGLLLALLATVLVVAVAGAILDIRLARTRGERAAVSALADPSTPGLQLGQPIRSSFGALTVEAATVDNGLTSQDLGGMNHGVSGLVAQGYAEITVQVTINNTTHHTVVVQASQFRMLRQRGAKAGPTAVPASATTLQAGPLPGRASINVRVTFVTPTDGARLWLQYADPGRVAPGRVELGSTAKIAAAAGGHQH